MKLKRIAASLILALTLAVAAPACKTARKNFKAADKDETHPNRCKVLIKEKLIVVGEKKDSKPYYEAAIGQPFLSHGQLDPELAKILQNRCGKLAATGVSNALITFDHDFVTEFENETFAITSNGTHQTSLSYLSQYSLNYTFSFKPVPIATLEILFPNQSVKELSAAIQKIELY
jgi:hypothetical protein